MVEFGPKTCAGYFKASSHLPSVRMASVFVLWFFIAGARHAEATNKAYQGCDSITGFCAAFRLFSLSVDGLKREMTACCGLDGCCCHSCSPDCVPDGAVCCDDCCDFPLIGNPPAHVCCSNPFDEGPGSGTACHTASPPAGACPGGSVVISRIRLVDSSMNTVATLCNGDCPSNCDAPPITRSWTFGFGPEDVLTVLEMIAYDAGEYDLLIEGTVNGNPIGGVNGYKPPCIHMPLKPKRPPVPAVGAAGLSVITILILVVGGVYFRKRAPTDFAI